MFFHAVTTTEAKVSNVGAVKEILAGYWCHFDYKIEPDEGATAGTFMIFDDESYPLAVAQDDWPTREEVSVADSEEDDSEDNGPEDDGPEDDDSEDDGSEDDEHFNAWLDDAPELPIRVLVVSARSRSRTTINTTEPSRRWPSE